MPALCGKINMDEVMNSTAILVTIISSLLSGLIGVAISAYFFGSLEKKKLKVDTARRLIGNRHNIAGDGFQQAMNEVMIVFSDTPAVIRAMDEFWKVIATVHGPGRAEAVNSGLINLLKAICASIGLHPKELNDSQYLLFFSVPKTSTGEKVA